MWPSCVTAVSIVRSVRADSGEMTRTASGAGIGVRTPSGPTVASTIRGGMRTPSLATAWYMPAICSAVTERPCPMGRLPKVEPDQVSRAGTRPGLSPGSPTPVRLPRPKRASMSAKRSSPTSRAAMIVPTFDDFARIPVSV